MSIFVNPAQFAPSEDLSSYPRTIENDLRQLSEASRGSKTVSALFLPPVSALYPSGIVQDVTKQVGTFVEVKGYSHQMEGSSRPTFFRGVATVVLKLFNIVQVRFLRSSPYIRQRLTVMSSQIRPTLAKKIYSNVSS